MKNRHLILIITLTIAAIISGCGRSEEKNSTSEYIDTEVQENTEEVQKETEESITENTEILSQEYTFTDEKMEFVATGLVEVMNKPDADGEVIGEIEEGKTVEIVGKCNETNWYKILYNKDFGYISDRDVEDSIVTDETEKSAVLSDSENNSSANNDKSNIGADTYIESDIPYAEYYDAESCTWECPHCGCIAYEVSTLENWMRYYDDNGVCGSYPWNGDNYVNERGELMLWVADPSIGHAGFYYTGYIPTQCGYCGADYTMYETHVGGNSTYYGDAEKILMAHAASVHGMYFDFIDYDSIPNELWEIAEQ